MALVGTHSVTHQESLNTLNNKKAATLYKSVVPCRHIVVHVRISTSYIQNVYEGLKSSGENPVVISYHETEVREPTVSPKVAVPTLSTLLYFPASKAQTAKGLYNHQTWFQKL